MTDLIFTAILVAILGAAARYVYKAKKSGAKCIGCSVQGGCAHKNGASSCGCSCEDGSGSCGGCH